MRYVAFNLAILVLIAGCASSTVIRTVPEGAKLYLNDEYVGETPYNHEDTKIVGSRTSVRIEKSGYETLHTSITRNEEVNVGAIIGGIFFLFPFLWTMNYKATHQYELEPRNNRESPELSGDEKAITDSQYNQLMKLKKLLDEGIITQEEFEKRKAEILD